MSRLRRRFDKEVEMSRGRFGKFGGQYVPETLMNELRADPAGGAVQLL